MTESRRHIQPQPQESGALPILDEIPLESFSPDQTLQPILYKNGQQINRDNFISWYVFSFAISRGDPDVQYGYIRWSSAQTGLDFHSTFQNFLRAGAKNCLSPAELTYIQDAYNRISIHHEADRKFLEEGSEPTNPHNVLAIYASDFSDGEDNENGYVDTILKDFENLEEFENLSWEEFLEWSKSKITQ